MYCSVPKEAQCQVSFYLIEQSALPQTNKSAPFEQHVLNGHRTLLIKLPQKQLSHSKPGAWTRKVHEPKAIACFAQLVIQIWDKCVFFFHSQKLLPNWNLIWICANNNSLHSCRLLVDRFHRHGVILVLV